MAKMAPPLQKQIPSSTTQLRRESEVTILSFHILWNDTQGTSKGKYVMVGRLQGWALRVINSLKKLSQCFVQKLCVSFLLARRLGWVTWVDLNLSVPMALCCLG